MYQTDKYETNNLVRICLLNELMKYKLFYSRYLNIQNKLIF